MQRMSTKFTKRHQRCKTKEKRCKYYHTLLKCGKKMDKYKSENKIKGETIKNISCAIKIQKNIKENTSQKQT